MPAPAPPPAPNPSKGAVAVPPFRWRQTSTPPVVTALLEVPNVVQDSVRLDWGSGAGAPSTHLSVTFRDKAGVEYALSGELWGAVLPASSLTRVSVLDTNLVVLMEKAAGGHWEGLFSVKGSATAAAAAATAGSGADQNVPPPAAKQAPVATPTSPAGGGAPASNAGASAGKKPPAHLLFSLD